MKFFGLLLAAVIALNISAADIYLAGDSTMSPYHEKYKPLAGWGEMLKRFTKNGVKIYNRAVGGRSTKSFRTKGWEGIINKMKKGDFVIIQFGHNDASKNPKSHADPEKEFPANMRRYVKEIKAKGGIPVIVSLTAACRFDKNGKAINSPTQQRYADAAKKAAAEEKIAFIDLNKWMLDELTKMGKKNAQEKIFMHLPPKKYSGYPKGLKDDLHLKDSGALYLAAGVIKMAKDAKLPIGKCFNSTPRTK